MPSTDSRIISLPNDNREAYSDRTAWILASCAQLAYSKTTDDLKKGLQPFHLAFKKPFYCDKSLNMAYLALHKTYAVLAFKGTVPSEPETVAMDAKFLFKPWKYGEAHAGFLDTIEELRPMIEPEVKKIKTPIFITGHSLGGALALLASILLKGQERFSACYTYGCPRVGNEQFADHLFKVPVYRCVHRADLVPGVPLLAMGYRQYGDVRFLSNDNRVCGGSEAVWRRFCATTLSPWNWPFCIADHGIQNYVDILHEYALSRNP
ncbi:MAG TPA: lipase family protein [bacterium]|nr:lipase family protein [bacterium]